MTTNFHDTNLLRAYGNENNSIQCINVAIIFFALLFESKKKCSSEKDDGVWEIAITQR